MHGREFVQYFFLNIVCKGIGWKEIFALQGAYLALGEGLRMKALWKKTTLNF